MSEVQDFVEALGVEVVEVEDLDGKCAVWSANRRKVRICRNLCARRREKALVDVLGRVELVD